MSVTLLRNYAGYTSGQVVTLDSDTESALVAQGLATAITNSPQVSSRVGGPDTYATTGGVLSNVPQAGLGPVSPVPGAYFWPNIALGSLALTSYETNGVAQVAGTINYADIFVPFSQSWTGVGILNGTTVGTHNVIGVLYGANGALLAQTASTLSASASVFQNIAFTSKIILPAGRYFIGFQFSGTTPTPRHLLAANGSSWITGTVAGTFGTIPSSITPATTFTTAVGPICQLYV